MSRFEIKRAIRKARKDMEIALKEGRILDFIRLESEIDFLQYKLLSH